jgi:hypothetical protein
MKKIILKKIKVIRKNIRKWFSTGRLIFLLIISLIISTFSLRQNNIEVLRLYNKVIDADKYNGDLDATLTELQSFSSSHMNTELRQPVELIERYNTEATNRIKEAQAKIPNIEEVYQEAQKFCSKSGIPSTVIAKCASDYALEKTDPNYDPNSPLQYKLPDPAEYTYRFASPHWTPDLAGLSLFIFMVCFLILLFRSAFRIYASSKLLKKSS